MSLPPDSSERRDVGAASPPARMLAYAALALLIVALVVVLVA